MTFIDRKTSRQAQKARNASKDRKGRPNGKFATPDRPGTNLAYSLTGQSERRPQTALEAALADAGVVVARKPRPKRQKPADARLTAQSAMSRIARAGQPRETR